MKKIQAISVLAAISVSVALPSACSDIAEADRLTVVNQVEKDTIAPRDTIKADTIDFFAPQGRHALIEDFTGQDCVNCPNATLLISQLQDMYGHDRVIAVGIHSGPLGVKPEKNPEGLATPLGDTYYNYWRIEMQPYGVINRSDGTLSTDWWAAKVAWDLSDELPDPSVNVWPEATIGNDRKATLTVTVAGLEHTSAKLQLWLVEDSIVAFQKMPDGTTRHDYVHNHVLRDAVNGEWGEEFTLDYGDVKTFSYSYNVPTQWHTRHLRLVAFAYNDERVLQTATTEMKINDK